MTNHAVRALIEQYIAAYNHKNLAAMLQTLHPEVVFQNIAGGTVNASTHGIAEFAALAEQSLPLFSERHQEIVDFAAGPGYANTSIAFRAVVANDLPNGLVKGQVLNLSGRSEFEFKDGLIVKIVDIS